jgi:lipid A 3-O-deacylase
MSFGETKARIRSEHNMLSGYLDLSGMDAYARDVQDYIHDIRLFDRFDGWSNELRDGPGIILIYEKKDWRREPWTKLPGELKFDVVPRISGSIGNVLSYVNLGCAVRYGYNIPRFSDRLT